jgi:hypothetical protein
MANTSLYACCVAIGRLQQRQSERIPRSRARCVESVDSMLCANTARQHTHARVHPAGSRTQPPHCTERAAVACLLALEHTIVVCLCIALHCIESTPQEGSADYRVPLRNMQCGVCLQLMPTFTHNFLLHLARMVASAKYVGYRLASGRPWRAGMEWAAHRRRETGNAGLGLRLPRAHPTYSCQSGPERPRETLLGQPRLSLRQADTEMSLCFGHGLCLLGLCLLYDFTELFEHYMFHRCYSNAYH